MEWNGRQCNADYKTRKETSYKRKVEEEGMGMGSYYTMGYPSLVPRNQN